MSDRALFVSHQIDFVGGTYCIASGPRKLQSIKLAGEPVSEFQAGWYPKVLLDVGTEIYLLELARCNGQKATWFVDKYYNHITDNFHVLSKIQQKNLLQTLQEPILEVYTSLLSAAVNDLSENAKLLNLINEQTARFLVAMTLARVAVPCNLINVQEATQSNSKFQLIAEGMSLQHVTAALRWNLQEHVDQALSRGYLVCPSPVTGEELKTTESLVIHEHRMAFRFIEPTHKFVFYISATHHPFRVADLYIPALNAVFLDLPDDTRTPNSEIMVDYLTHFVTHSAAILSYFGVAERMPAVVCRGFPGMHIGHHLWNELTAFDRIARRFKAGPLPVIIIPNAARGSEAYGPIDRLFPEWAGKVDRSLRMESETLGNFVYRKNFLLFRALDQHVSAGLSQRLIETACTAPITSQSKARIVDLKSQGFEIIVIGLRVENRTATNLYDCFEKLVTYLATKFERLAVVVDGHNSRLMGDFTTAFDSFGQTGSSNPILIELELAIRLNRRFEYTNVQIVNMVGQSVSDSICWTQESLFFIAIWGASLAKYRWACNKVGLVISSRSNLTARHDLHIYDSAEFQENPVPILYVDPTSVTDCPEVAVLFSPVNPVPASYANFHVDCQKLLPQIDQLLELAGATRVLNMPKPILANERLVEP